MNQKSALFTTFFGLGKLPLAPATWASLPPVVLYQVLGYLWPEANATVMALFVVLGSWICLNFASPVDSVSAPFVADKAAGQGLTLFMIALLEPANICNAMALGFILFRVFDITKPWPCGVLSRRPAGLGILLPTLMAGLYAGVASLAAIRLMPVCFI